MVKLILSKTSHCQFEFLASAGFPLTKIRSVFKAIKQFFIRRAVGEKKKRNFNRRKRKLEGKPYLIKINYQGRINLLNYRFGFYINVNIISAFVIVFVTTHTQNLLGGVTSPDRRYCVLKDCVSSTSYSRAVYFRFFKSSFSFMRCPYRDQFFTLVGHFHLVDRFP